MESSLPLSIFVFRVRGRTLWRRCCRSAKKRNRGNGECCRPRHCAPSYHFVIAVWRLKAAQLDQREVLGSHR